MLNTNDEIKKFIEGMKKSFRDIEPRLGNISSEELLQSSQHLQNIIGIPNKPTIQLALDFLNNLKLIFIQASHYIIAIKISVIAYRFFNNVSRKRVKHTGFFLG